MSLVRSPGNDQKLIAKLDSRRGLRVGLRKWRNGPTDASVIWWHIRPSRALTRMRSDVRGYPLWPGSETLRSKGRIQMSETSHLQIGHIPLATRATIRPLSKRSGHDLDL